jgi:hypothetical protein
VHPDQVLGVTRVTVEIEVIDRKDDESIMSVIVKPWGRGLGEEFIEPLPLDKSGWQLLQEIVDAAPELPAWLKKQRPHEGS